MPWNEGKHHGDCSTGVPFDFAQDREPVERLVPVNHGRAAHATWALPWNEEMESRPRLEAFQVWLIELRVGSCVEAEPQGVHAFQGRALKRGNHGQNAHATSNRTSPHHAPRLPVMLGFVSLYLTYIGALRQSPGTRGKKTGFWLPPE